MFPNLSLVQVPELPDRLDGELGLVRGRHQQHRGVLRVRLQRLLVGPGQHPVCGEDSSSVESYTIHV